MTGSPLLLHAFRRPAVAGLLIAAGLTGCRSAVPAANDLAAALTTRGGPAPAEDLTDAQKTDVRLALARSLERAADWNAAAEAYEATLAADPEHVHALRRLAVVRCRQGRAAEADDLFRRALAANPGSAAVFADLGYLDLLRGRLAAAERNLRQALAVDPTHAAARGNLGLTLARSGREDKALAALRAAGAGKSSDANLAFALATGGRPDAARTRLAAARSAAPDDVRLAALAAALGGLRTDAAARPAAAEVPAE